MMAANEFVRDLPAYCAADVCADCLAEGDELLQVCSRGIHRLVKREPWVGVLIDAWFDVGSIQEAHNLFGEIRPGSEQYILVRKLTAEELQLLVEGRAKVRLSIEVGDV